MTRGRLFNYAVVYHPEQKVEQGVVLQGKSELIVPVTSVLASSENEVRIIASQAIGPEYNDLLEFVEIIVRPF